MLTLAPLSLAVLLNAAPPRKAVPAPTSAPADANAQLVAQLCNVRTTCTVTERKKLQSAHKGETVEWVTLLIGAKDGEVERTEFWRTVTVGTKLTERQLFYRFTDDSGGLQPILAVTSDSVKMNWSQFRNIDSATFEVATSTLRVRNQDELHHWPSGGPTVAPPFFHAHWDWLTMTGSGTRDNVFCDKPGKIMPADTRQFLAIPEVDLPAALLSNWKNLKLGTCAVDVGAKGTEGFQLAGEPVSGSQMKVLLASDRVLLIEIPNTVFKQGLTSWLDGDHLEVWLSTQLPNDEETPVGAEQWGILLPSAKVIAAAGEPAKAIVAQVSVRPATAGPGSTLVRLELPRPVRDGTSLAVSYSAGTGDKVKSLRSTSQICFGSGTSLGLVARIPANEASCKVEAGSLMIKQVEPLRPGPEPLLDNAKPYATNQLKALFLP